MPVILITTSVKSQEDEAETSTWSGFPHCEVYCSLAGYYCSLFCVTENEGHSLLSENLQPFTTHNVVFRGLKELGEPAYIIAHQSHQ